MVVTADRRDFKSQKISAAMKKAKRTLSTCQILGSSLSLGSVDIRHDGVKGLLRGNRSDHSRLVATTVCVSLPRLQHVAWPGGIISFVVEGGALAGLGVEVHISIVDTASVAQVGAAIAGGGAGAEPKDEHDAIEG